MSKELAMGLEFENGSGAAPESEPPSDDDERLHVQVAILRSRVDKMDRKLDKILASVPTATEKRIVVALFTIVAGAVAKHYGIDLP